MSHNELAQLLRPEEFFALARVSRAKGYAMIASKMVPSVHMGRSVRVPLAGYLDWVKRNTIGGEGQEAA